MMTSTGIRSRVIFLALGLCPLIVSGCHVLGAGSAARSSLEARLRGRETKITRLERELATLQNELQASQREIGDLRKNLAATSDAAAQSPLLSEQARTTFRINSVEITSLLSGGLDRDDTPGDEILSVLLAPVDSSGEVLRADGSIEMNVYDLTKPTPQQLIGSWVFDVESTRELWHSGVIGKGFHLNVTWKTPPASGQVLAHCRFTTTDDRAFDTNATLKVAPESQPAATRKPIPELTLD